MFRHSLSRILFVCMLLFHSGVFSQPIPIETLIGHQRVYGFSLITRPFSDSTRFGFFSLTSFNGSYNNESNELVTCNQLTFSLTKRLKIAAGSSFNGLLQYFPSAGFQFTWFKGPLLVVLNPGLEFSQAAASNTFGILQWQPALGKKLELYTRAQGLFIHGISKGGVHQRSFWHLRLGLARKKYAAGLGFNADYYGSPSLVMYNFGGFLRYEFM